jgi:hypothetical protein
VSADPADETCPRPQASSAIPEAVDLGSENGLLTVDFAFRSDVDAHGRTRYCFIYKDGVESPNVRLRPGDLLIVRLAAWISGVRINAVVLTDAGG